MAFDRFDHDMNIISALDPLPNDETGLTAEQLQAKFDEGGLAQKAFINAFLDALEAETGSLSVGAANMGGTDTSDGNVGAKLNWLRAHIDSVAANFVLGLLAPGSVTPPMLSFDPATQDELNVLSEAVIDVSDVADTALERAGIYRETTNVGSAYTTTEAVTPVIGQPVRVKWNTSSPGTTAISLNTLAVKDSRGNAVKSVTGSAITTLVYNGVDFISQAEGGEKRFIETPNGSLILFMGQTITDFSPELAYAGGPGEHSYSVDADSVQLRGVNASVSGIIDNTVNISMGQVDVTNYSTLKVALSVHGGFGQGSRIGVADTLAGALTASSSWKAANTGAQIVSLDVSSISGSKYIRFDTTTGGGTGTYYSAYAKLMACWLEP